MVPRIVRTPSTKYRPVGDRSPVVDDRVTDVGAPVGDADGLIRERSVVGEAGYESLDVLFLSALVGPPALAGDSSRKSLVSLTATTTPH